MVDHFWDRECAAWNVSKSGPARVVFSKRSAVFEEKFDETTWRGTPRSARRGSCGVSWPRPYQS